jgi:predicted lipoprotein with Yx(FWY)xxD motif
VSFPDWVPRVCPARHRRHGTIFDPVQRKLELLQIEPTESHDRVGRMHTLKLVIAAAAVIAGTAGCGHATAPAAKPETQTGVRVEVAQSSLGPILTDQNGRTLYAFVHDKNGTSSCTGDCLATWPALASRQAPAVGTGAAKDLLAQTTRAEGTVQATYGNWPLYYYVGDVGPGDVDGQGVDDAWFVVGADGKLIKTTP